MTEKAIKLKQSLLNVNKKESIEILDGLASEFETIPLIESIIVPIMQEIGEGWEDGTIALSQVYMSGKIIETWVDEALPPGHADRKDQPKMGIAVLEDYHLLGKRIIYSILRASGFELTDYKHISVIDLIKKIEEDELEVILISTLMLPSALKIKELKEKLVEKQIEVIVIVGGAPFRFDTNLWRDVGADYVATGAKDIIEIIEKIKKGGK